MNVKVTPQAYIPGVGRVDLLVGATLIIEIDSRAHHLGAGYQTDRERDRNAVALGYTVIRVTYEDVVFRWPQTCAQLLAVIRRDEHRKPPTMPVRSGL